MKTAHKGMGITDADFNALVEDLVKALDKFHVGATEQHDSLRALGGMKGRYCGAVAEQAFFLMEVEAPRLGASTSIPFEVLRRFGSQ